MILFCATPFQFPTSGVTAICSSELGFAAIHTWPEAGFASVDIAMVSKHEGEELLDELLSRFNVTEKDFTWALGTDFSGKGIGHVK